MDRFLDKLTHLMPDGGHAELRCQKNMTRRVSMINGNLTANSATDVSGVAARAMKDGVWGHSSMAECSVEAARTVLKAAEENAAFMAGRVPKAGVYAAAVPTVQLMLPEVALVRDYDRTGFIKALDSMILELCPKLIGRTLSIFEERIERDLLVCDGTSGYTVMQRSYVYVFLTAEGKDGQPLELFRAFDEPCSMTDVRELEGGIVELYEMLMAKCEGVYAEAGMKTVIFDGALAGMLAHEAVGHTVEADLVLGGSVAAHNVGKAVASEMVSMTDFAHTVCGKEAPLPVYLDDEGTVAEDCPIIVDGVLREFMNSRESAAHFGMTPRGNARAFSFSDEPLIRMRNTVILPGKDKLEDMIASVDDGYYFVQTGNGQADTTGEFMFGITMGYEIKKGKLGRAILDTTISGVAFEMLKTVDMMSDTLKLESSGYCGKKQPMPVGLGGPDIRCKVMVGGR